MDERMKQRLIGAAVLVVAAVVFVPMLLDQERESPSQPSPGILPPQPSPSPPPPPPEDADARAVPLDSKPPPVVEKPAKAVTAPAAVEPAPRAPAVKPGFAVQLGSFSKADNALGLRDKLKAKGYKAFLKSSGDVTRVYVGPQRDRAAAEKELKKLLADIKMKGIVVKLPG